MKDERHVEIPYVCNIRKPDDVIRCTRAKGHAGEHWDVFAGELQSSGVRPAVCWPRRPGETQAD